MARKLKWQVRCGSMGRTVSRHITKAAAQKAAKKHKHCRVSKVKTYRTRKKK